MESKSGIIELWCESGKHYTHHTVFFIRKAIVKQEEFVTYDKNCLECSNKLLITVPTETWENIMAECVPTD